VPCGSLRVWHPVIAPYAFLRVTTFLVTDDHHGTPFDPGQAADNGQVVGIHPSPWSSLNSLQIRADVVERVRPVRMARELCGSCQGVRLAKMLV